MPLTKRAKTEPRRGNGAPDQLCFQAEALERKLCPGPGPAEFPGRGVALFIPPAAVKEELIVAHSLGLQFIVEAGL